MGRPFSVLLAVALVAGALVPASPARADGPTVAVLDFSTVGLTSNWYGNFQPGVALSDLVTDQVVNGGKLSVLDRKNISSTLDEHKLSASGEVDPATAIQAGRLIGARYLISGNILQLDHTGSSGASAGGLIGGTLGGLVGGVKTDRVTLKVAVRVVDAKTGRIVQSFSDEKTASATSLGGGGFSGYTAGSYSNANFVNSSMGHLINDEAIQIAAHLDPTKFASGPAPAALSGHVIAVDAGHIIVNIGSAKGAAIGQFLDVVKVRLIKDPDSGKMLTINDTIGKIELMSVSADSAVGRVVAGKIVVGMAVVSE
ncbi:MAG TPA: CsgG/HfaB family protein [Candidatus Elarobacter sp.]|jgi:curli biogenesis system outer membrane secretion channel CsgG